MSPISQPSTASRPTRYRLDDSARRNELATKPEEVEAILKAGAEKARAVARQTLADVRKLTGLGGEEIN